MTITIEQAQLSLAELIARSSQGERIIITQDQRPVAEICPVTAVEPKPVFGSCKGMLNIVTDDDEHLADFEEYMR